MCNVTEWIFKAKTCLVRLACAIVKMNPNSKKCYDGFNIKGAAQKIQILLVVAGTVLNNLLS